MVSITEDVKAIALAGGVQRAVKNWSLQVATKSNVFKVYIRHTIYVHEKENVLMVVEHFCLTFLTDPVDSLCFLCQPSFSAVDIFDVSFQAHPDRESGKEIIFFPLPISLSIS